MNRLIKIANDAVLPSSPTFPEFDSGDLVEVHQKVRERDKERIKVIVGTVIRKSGDALANKTFTLRKISNGISVGLIFPLASPLIDKIIVKQRSKVRQSRIYYFLETKGKSSKLKKKKVVRRKEGEA